MSEKMSQKQQVENLKIENALLKDRIRKLEETAKPETTERIQALFSSGDERAFNKEMGKLCPRNTVNTVSLADILDTGFRTGVLK
jgi:hypothetical protein